MVIGRPPARADTDGHPRPVVPSVCVRGPGIGGAEAALGRLQHATPDFGACRRRKCCGASYWIVVVGTFEINR